MTRAFARGAMPLLLVVLALFAIALLPSVNWADDAPDDFPVTTSNDMDGDGQDDAIDAAPSGMDPEASDPGFVVVTASDGTSVLLTGREAGDFFGAAVAVAGDLNGDTFADIIVGAPRDNGGRGRAYVFYGPFRNYENPELSVEDADFIFESPDAGDVEFGSAVRPISDANCDGVPDIGIGALATDGQGNPVQHTYVVSGVTGDPIYLIVDEAPFDPWIEVDGDAEGDGDIDQNDIDIITRNQGRTGPLLTRRDGDFNADAVVDSIDLAMAQAGLGSDHFSPIDDCNEGCPGQPPPGFHCIERCDGEFMEVPENVWRECRMLVCQAWCQFEVEDLGATLIPIDSYDDLYIYHAFGGLEIDGVEWDVLQGSENIDVASELVGHTFEFYPRKEGIVQVRARNEVCTYICEVTMPPQYILFVDSDADNLPDAWENEWGLDPYDPSDASQDNDGDGLNNLFEYAYDLNPFQPDAPGDSDGDGIPDNCEQQISSDPQDPLDPPPGLDSDFDTIWDAYELCVFGTDPFYSDSDGDGMPDGWEVQYGLSPLFAGNGMLDPDGDNIPNLLEFLTGSNPNVHNSSDPNAPGPELDADSDGFIDWLETQFGTDPMNAGSYPTPQMLESLDANDMSWMVVDNVVEPGIDGIVEMCVGECFRMHAQGFATSWTVVQGKHLLVEAEPDTLDDCTSGLWCIVAPGDIVIMSSTPSGSGFPVIGFVHIRALPVEECDEPCVLLVEGPEAPCVGEEIVLTASESSTNDPECNCGAQGEQFAWHLGNTIPGGSEFVGDVTGSQVTLRLLKPGTVHVSASRGECEGGTSIDVRSEIEVTFERHVTSNWPIDNCPKNSGKRVFPDKVDIGDSNSTNAQTNRKTVKVKASLCSEAADITIYYKIFDVDDPSTDQAPVDSNGEVGADNRDSVSQGMTGQVTTDQNGQTEFDLLVSSHPGDNYRIITSTSQTDLNAVTQAQADGRETLPDNVSRSEMLTVWRHAFVEIDSMVPASEQEIWHDGILRGFQGPPGVPGPALASAVWKMTPISYIPGAPPVAVLKEWQVPPGSGPFQLLDVANKGVVEIYPGAATAIKIDDGLPGNDVIVGVGETWVQFNPSVSIIPPGGIPFAAEDNDWVGSETMSGTVTEIAKSGTNYVYSLNIVAPPATQEEWDDFEGGEISLAGGEWQEIIAVNSTASTVTTSQLGVLCRFKDDDDHAILPTAPDTSLLVAKYSKAYVLPLPNGGGVAAYSGTSIPFDPHVGGTGSTIASFSDNYQGSLGYETPDCWIAYVVAAFQDEIDNDLDSGDFAGAWGVTGFNIMSNTTVAAGGEASLVFMETIRDELNGPHAGTPDALLPLTVAHEMGHQFGLDHLANSLMAVSSSGGTNYEFAAVHCHLIRLRVNSPGN